MVVESGVPLGEEDDDEAVLKTPPEPALDGASASSLETIHSGDAFESTVDKPDSNLTEGLHVSTVESNLRRISR